MSAAYFLTTLGLVPYFASRALLPVFMTALVLRLGAEWSFLTPLLGLTPVTDVPAWATSNVALFTLGVGASLEALLVREPALREALSLTDAQIKAVLALLVCLILAPESEAAGAPGSEPGSALTTSMAWLGISSGYYAWAALIAGLVSVLSYTRTRLLAWLADLDEEDDLGLRGVLAWLEDAFSVVGVFIVLVVPALAAGATLGAVVCSFLLTTRVRKLRGADLITCVGCSATIEACAPHCPECRTVQPSPCAVGVLGRIQAKPAPRDHSLQLKFRKRCGHCGTRVHGSGVELTCSRCGTPVFASQQAVEAYLQALSRGVAATLLVMAAFGAVPVLGLFAGVFYFRLTLLAAIRQYTSTSTRVFGRWFLRFANAGLLLLQPIPVLGMVTLPLTALSSTWFYTQQLRRDAARLKAKDYSETLRR